MPRLSAVLAAVSWCLVIVPATAQGGALSVADRQAISGQLETYRTAWLAGDAAKIKSLFLPQAVFLPHHGLEPVRGLDALSAFWWPVGGPKFEILRFDLATERIEGDGDLAYAWGRQVLEWSTTDASGTTRTRTRGNHLTVLRRTAQGWKIELQMSDDRPNETF